MVDRRGGQPLLHQLVVQQFVLADALEVRQPGSVPQHVADGDRVLAVGAELRPVRRDGLVVGQQAAIDQSVNDGRRDSFGRGEHHRAGVDGPRLLTRAVGPARPDVDDRPPVDVDRQGATAEPSAREQTCEHADDVGKPRIGGTLHTAGQAFFGAKQRRLCHTANNASSSAAVHAESQYSADHLQDHRLQPGGRRALEDDVLEDLRLIALDGELTGLRLVAALHLVLHGERGRRQWMEANVFRLDRVLVGATGTRAHSSAR